MSIKLISDEIVNNERVRTFDNGTIIKTPNNPSIPIPNNPDLPPLNSNSQKLNFIISTLKLKRHFK
ncbi:hypothetical protein ES703_14884 [subsurface metagenome]